MDTQYQVYVLEHEAGKHDIGLSEDTGTHFWTKTGSAKLQRAFRGLGKRLED